MAWRGADILKLLLAGPLLTRQIATSMGISADAAKSHCQKLRARGLITSCEGVHEITPSGREWAASDRVIKSGPSADKAQARQKATLRARAWRAMRMRDGFSLDDLLTMLCDGTERDATTNLDDYIRALAGAGYLLPLPRRGNGQHPQRYRLRRERNTGPEAPAWNKPNRTVTDANTGEVFIVPRRKDAKQEAPHA